MDGRGFFASCCMGIMFCHAAIPSASGVPGKAQTVAELIRDLSDKDAAVRFLSAKALGDHAAEADEIVPALLAALKDKRPAVRWRAARSLGQIGPAAAKAIEPLIAMHNDRQMDVRIFAWEALGRIGIVDERTPGLLVRAFGRPMEVAVASVAVKAMAALGNRAVPMLNVALKHEKARLRLRAAEALALMGADARGALPALRTAMKDDSGNVRVAAAMALAQIRPEGIAHLARVLRTKQGGSQSAAAYALLNADPAPIESLDALTSALPCGDPHAGAYAARALGRLGRSAEPALAVLVKALSDSEHEVRRRAAEALGTIGPKAVPAVLKVLKDGDPPARAAAAYALGEIGPHARAAAPILMDLLADKSHKLRYAAAYALGGIGPVDDRVIPALIAVVKNPSEDGDQGMVRRMAARGLARMGPAAGQAARVLVAGLKDKDLNVVVGSAEALGAIGPVSDDVVPALIALLETPDDSVRRSAVAALARMGPAASGDLVQALSHRHGRVRAAAAEVLGRITRSSEEAVPALAKVIGDFYRPVRRRAIGALGNIGAAAKAAVPALIAATKSEDDFTQLHAARALEKIGPPAIDALPALAKLANDPADLLVGHAAAKAMDRIGGSPQELRRLISKAAAKPSIPPLKVVWTPPAPRTFKSKNDFLAAFPDARQISWPAPTGKQADVILFLPPRVGSAHDGIAPQAGLLAVFDGTGRPLYQRSLVQKSTQLPETFHPPAIVAVPGRVFAYVREKSVPKTHFTDLILVGVGARGAKELELKYECRSSYPHDYSSRVWLEDIDGDGTPEICRYFRNHYHMGGGKPKPVPLECVRWDPEKTEWRRLESLAGRREQTWRPPITWHVLGKLDRAKRTIDLTLRIENLSDIPVALDQPGEQLQDAPTYDARMKRPDAGFPFPLIFRAGREWGTTTWKVSPAAKRTTGLVIQPAATVTCRFRVTVAANETLRETFNIRLIGRARWGKFESTFLEQYTPAFGREGSFPVKQ